MLELGLSCTGPCPTWGAVCSPQPLETKDPGTCFGPWHAPTAPRMQAALPAAQEARVEYTTQRSFLARRKPRARQDSSKPKPEKTRQQTSLPDKVVDSVPIRSGQPLRATVQNFLIHRLTTQHSCRV